MPDVIILDWDETLLPTDYIERFQGRKDMDLASISCLDVTIYSLLLSFREAGDRCFILTNAGKTWVMSSCKRYFPISYNLIKHMYILSARDLYENADPEINNWKKNAVMTRREDLLRGVTNLISVGDSEYERNAVIHFGKIHGVNIKSLMIKSRLDPLELSRVLKFLESFITVLKNRETNEDLMIRPDPITERNKWRTLSKLREKAYLRYSEIRTVLT